METLVVICLVASCLSALFAFLAFVRAGKRGGGDFRPIEQQVESLKQTLLSEKEFVRTMLEMSAQANKNAMDTLVSSMSDRLNALERRVEEMSRANETRLRSIQEDNAKQLQKMREVVDEKLNTTLEARLGQSFGVINERLEAVYKGLGEMQGLARGVGDLKKVLGNVKVRGTFGEVQLEALLEQILSPGQFMRNVRIDPSTDERVDFAVVLPGKDAAAIYLPIDSKFPMEEYRRLLDASENADAEAYEKGAKLLENRIMAEGKKIAEKYVKPPFTTDFGILYLPMEGLYAEVLKRNGVIESLQRERIVLCGPTTLGALLNSLQMGFKTVAIEKRSAELWKLLSAFKTEFGRFAALLEKTQKKLSEASDSIDDAAKKTRTIHRKLAGVNDLSEGETDLLLVDPIE